MNLSLSRMTNKTSDKKCKTTRRTLLSSPKIIDTLPRPQTTQTSSRNSINSDEAVKTMRSVISDYNQNEIHADGFEDLNTIMSELEKQIIIKIPQEQTPVQIIPEKDTSTKTCGTTGINYDDIMSFLGQLEQGTTLELASTLSKEELSPKTPYAFKEDLAIATLQLEEKTATITLLKNELRSERKSACEKLESQRKSYTSKLRCQEEKYKTIIKRHQSFIEQLLADKRELGDNCDALTVRLKEAETKFQRDLKVSDERHLVELQRAKEHCAAAERIRRERWVETRTTRIKEMTVKGLEPELRSMIEQHENEIQKLRNNHMQELQDTELRMVRQSNQQLEQLRLELIASHEKMLSDEKNLLWSRYKENLEDQESQFQLERRKLLDTLKKERLFIAAEETRKEEEKEQMLRENQLNFQREIEALKNQQTIDKKTFEQTLRAEWEMSMADWKRQERLKFERAENRIRDESYRERDKQIEIAIGRLEEESEKNEISLRQSFENKIKSFTEKYDLDMQSMMESEKMQKEKCRMLREKLEVAQNDLEDAKRKLETHESELESAKIMIKELTEEKNNAKLKARQELDGEKRELEEKIDSLYHEINRGNVDRETWMAQLHSRIKLVMTQKVLVIRNLTKELSLARTRCEDLEKLLDQQRRELILRNFD